jgi:pepF/M3 family oligoendopeptidase
MSPKKDLGKLPHWDLSNVYPGLETDAFSGDVEKLKEEIDEMDGFMKEQAISRGGKVPVDAAELGEILDGLLERMNALYILYGTLEAYLYSFISTDSYNATAKRLLSELEMQGVRLERQNVLFRGWIGTVAEDADRLQTVLALDGKAAQHAFYLKEMAEQSRYLMTELEETLASELSLSGAAAWEKLQGIVTSQIKVPFERDGETQELPITMIINMRTDPVGEVRRRAYEAEMAVWESVQEPLAACMNGIKGTVNTLNKRRGREDSLHSSIDMARIDRETLETMMGAMKDSFPIFRRYWKAKAMRLGVEQLPWWDLMAPGGDTGRVFTFEETKDFILENFGSYSDRLEKFAKRAFDSGWIDAEPRDGKGGGAFCMEVPAVDESRVLCNFDGSLDQLTTIAHELGHAYHNECQVGLTPLQKRTPMTLAETASIFCETIISEATLKNAANAQEELAILETSLIGSSQVIVDIYSRYLFEKEVFERRVDAQLSADDFCDIMRRAQLATYGDGLDPDHLHTYMWTWKPHYYSAGLSYYNYPYAFGLLFGLGLYAIYQQRGEGFKADYDQLLRSTGEGSAADLAARFDIDLHKPDFWNASLGVIAKQIDRYVAL